MIPPAVTDAFGAFIDSPPVASVIRFYDDAPAPAIAATAIFVLLNLFYFAPGVIFYMVVTSIVASIGAGLYLAPMVTACVLLGFAVVYGMYARWVFHEWEKSFSGHRLTRRAEACASNKEMPDVVK